MEPRYKVPSHTLLTNTCHKLYSSLKDDLLELCHNCLLQLPPNCGQAERLKATYITITAHFINNQKAKSVTD